MLLAGCGGGGSGGGGSRETGNPSGRILWTVTTPLPELRGIDTGTHEPVLEVEVAPWATEVTAFAVADDYVWIGREDGVLSAVDRKTRLVAGEVDLTPSDASEPAAIYHIAAGEGFAISSSQSANWPPILRVEAPSVSVVHEADVIEGAGYINGIRYDGTDIWIIEWNSFELLRVDPKTLAVRARLVLGQDPNDPNAFGPYYGYGYMADSGDTVWVLDTASERLLSIDKTTLTPRVRAELSGVFDLDSYIEFDANSRGVFLLLKESGIVVRFDPLSGERSNTYDLSDDGGVGAMALGSDRLYVTPNAVFVHEVREIDIETGSVLQTIDSIYSLDAIGVQR